MTLRKERPGRRPSRWTEANALRDGCGRDAEATSSSPLHLSVDGPLLLMDLRVAFRRAGNNLLELLRGDERP